jgi:four helix bundle protein
MTEDKRDKQYDLEERTLKFSRDVIGFTDALQRTLANIEIMKQLVRSSGSVGANYIEANESLSKKDFAVRVKICRKEAKESRYWLNLIQVNNESLERQRALLIKEATELTKIFGSIVEKCES